MKKKYMEFLAIYFVTRVYDIIVDKLKKFVGYVHHINHSICGASMVT